MNFLCRKPLISPFPAAGFFIASGECAARNQTADRQGLICFSSIYLFKDGRKIGDRPSRTFLHSRELEHFCAEQIVIPCIMEGLNDLFKVQTAVARITPVIVAKVYVDIDVRIIPDGLIQILFFDI